MALRGELTVPVRCPKCDEQFNKTLGGLKSSDGFSCPFCHVHIRYKHETLFYDAEEGSRVRTIGMKFVEPKQ
ncbi:MAG: hypothetical protein HC869_16305 [Rhodospirillales bacterium]|nr:hypothetical protein [Rhodospirillales bacterium]